MFTIESIVYSSSLLNAFSSKSLFSTASGTRSTYRTNNISQTGSLHSIRSADSRTVYGATTVSHYHYNGTSIYPNQATISEALSRDGGSYTSFVTIDNSFYSTTANSTGTTVSSSTSATNIVTESLILNTTVSTSLFTAFDTHVSSQFTYSTAIAGSTYSTTYSDYVLTDTTYIQTGMFQDTTTQTLTNIHAGIFVVKTLIADKHEQLFYAIDVSSGYYPLSSYFNKSNGLTQIELTDITNYYTYTTIPVGVPTTWTRHLPTFTTFTSATITSVGFNSTGFGTYTLTRASLSYDATATSTIFGYTTGTSIYYYLQTIFGTQLTTSTDSAGKLSLLTYNITSLQTLSTTVERIVEYVSINTAVGRTIEFTQNLLYKSREGGASMLINNPLLLVIQGNHPITNSETSNSYDSIYLNTVNSSTYPHCVVSFDYTSIWGTNSADIYTGDFSVVQARVGYNLDYRSPIVYPYTFVSKNITMSIDTDYSLTYSAPNDSSYTGTNPYKTGTGSYQFTNTGVSVYYNNKVIFGVQRPSHWEYAGLSAHVANQHGGNIASNVWSHESYLLMDSRTYNKATVKAYGTTDTASSILNSTFEIKSIFDTANNAYTVSKLSQYSQIENEKKILVLPSYSTFELNTYEVVNPFNVFTAPRFAGNFNQLQHTN